MDCVVAPVDQTFPLAALLVRIPLSPAQKAKGPLALMVGVDTQVFHGFVRCGAVGAITGVGNALKRHYHNFLWEYERANQRDVGGSN